MTVDLHAYWDRSRLSLEELQERLERHGISRAVLSPPCTDAYEPDKSPFMYAAQRFLLRSDLLRPAAELVSRSFYDGEGRLRSFWRLFTRGGKPIHKILAPDNRGLLDAVRERGSLYAWVWLNPQRMPDEAEVSECIAHPKAAGFKVHAYWHRATPRQARAVFSLARKHKRPLYLILTFGWLGEVEGLLREFSDVQVVFGYGGMPYFDALWRRLGGFPNAHVDLTSFHIDERGVEDAVSALGPDRCLYGSDCPYNFPGEDGRFDYGLSLRRVTRLKLTPEERERILGGNAERLLFGSGR